MVNKKVNILKLNNYYGINNISLIVWEMIEKELINMNYTFNYILSDPHNIHNSKWIHKKMTDLNKGDIDIIVIGDYLNFDNKIKKSEPIYYKKNLILYKKNDKKKKFYFEIFKFWIPFLFFFIFLSLISSLIYKFVFSHKDKFHINFFRLLNSNFGSNKNFYNSNKKGIYFYTFCILITLIIFLSTILLHSITLSKTIMYYKPEDNINIGIKNKNILVNVNDIYDKNKIKSLGGKIKNSYNTGSNLINEYLNNLEIYDGVLCVPEYLNNYTINKDIISIYEKDSKIDLNISKFNIGFLSISFPLSNKNNVFVQDINNILNKIKKRNEYLQQLCQNIYGNYFINNNKKNKGFVINSPCDI